MHEGEFDTDSKEEAVEQQGMLSASGGLGAPHPCLLCDGFDMPTKEGFDADEKAVQGDFASLDLTPLDQADQGGKS
eukprot:10856078-Karenia_brevis.AAC.1